MKKESNRTFGNGFSAALLLQKIKENIEAVYQFNRKAVFAFCTIDYYTFYNSEAR